MVIINNLQHRPLNRCAQQNTALFKEKLLVASGGQQRASRRSSRFGAWLWHRAGSPRGAEGASRVELVRRWVQTWRGDTRTCRRWAVLSRSARAAAAPECSGSWFWWPRCRCPAASLPARAALGEPRARRRRPRARNGRNDSSHLQGLLLKELINPPTVLSVVSAKSLTVFKC